MRKWIIIILLVSLISLKYVFASCTLSGLRHQLYVDTTDRGTVFFNTNGQLIVMVPVREDKLCVINNVEKIRVTIHVTNAMTGMSYDLVKVYNHDEIVNFVTVNGRDTEISLPVDSVEIRDLTTGKTIGSSPIKTALLRTISYVSSPVTVDYVIKGYNEPISANLSFRPEWVLNARKSVLKTKYYYQTEDRKYVYVDIPVIDNRQKNEIAGVVIVYTRGINDVSQEKIITSSNYEDLISNGQYFMRFKVPVDNDIRKIDHVYIIYGTAGVFDATSKIKGIDVSYYLTDKSSQQFILGLLVLLGIIYLIKHKKKKD